MPPRLGLDRFLRGGGGIVPSINTPPFLFYFSKALSLVSICPPPLPLLLLSAIVVRRPLLLLDNIVVHHPLPSLAASSDTHRPHNDISAACCSSHRVVCRQCDDISATCSRHVVLSLPPPLPPALVALSTIHHPCMIQ